MPAARLPYIVTADTTAPGGRSWTIYMLAYANEGGAYRVVSQQLHDGRWVLHANSKEQGFFQCEPSPETVCAWFNTAPRRADILSAP